MTQPSDNCLRKAEGRWRSIFRTLCSQQIAEAVQAADKNASSRHVPCPVHGGTDGFRLFKDWEKTGGGICNTCGPKRDGLVMLTWLTGMSYKECLREVFRLLEGEEVNTPNRQKVSREKVIQADEEKKERSANNAQMVAQTWRESFPLTDARSKLGCDYLAARSLGGIRYYKRIVRFHPRLFYRDKNVERAFYPGLLFSVVDSRGSPLTLHRIYLDPNNPGCKADVESPKKLMPYPEYERELKGGCIRLSPRSTDHATIGLAEGPETALSIHKATGLPTWSTLSSALLRNFTPPKGVKCVLIFADEDRSGEGLSAAHDLRNQIMSRHRLKCGIFRPRKPIPKGGKSVDWSDVLMQDGPSGFPEIPRI